VTRSHLHELADNLRLRGLTVVMDPDAGTVTATNPMHRLIATTIRCTGDAYLTEYDYEVGQRGDEPASAGRIAHLLAMPQRDVPLRPCSYCPHPGANCCVRLVDTVSGPPRPVLAHWSCATRRKVPVLYSLIETETTP
jgi:hypothetical protein